VNNVERAVLDASAMGAIRGVHTVSVAAAFLATESQVQAQAVLRTKPFKRTTHERDGWRRAYVGCVVGCTAQPRPIKRCARPPQHAACQIACDTCRTDRDGSPRALQDFALVISGHFRVVACAAAAPPNAAPSAQPSAQPVMQPSAAPVDETSVARPSEPSVVAAAGGQAQLMGAGCRGTRTVTSGSGLVDDGFGGKYEPRVTCEWLLRPGERPSCRTCHGTSLNLPGSA
jgi:hypothetical protein